MNNKNAQPVISLEDVKNLDMLNGRKADLTNQVAQIAVQANRQIGVLEYQISAVEEEISALRLRLGISSDDAESKEEK